MADRMSVLIGQQPGAELAEIRPIALKEEILGVPWPGSGLRGFGGSPAASVFRKNNSLLAQAGT
jgi:hypothetical protein